MKIMIFGMGRGDRNRLELSLERLGHEVVIESDAAAAIARIEETEIPVVIADGRLPRFDWVDLCRPMRSETRRLRAAFILVVGEDAEETYEAWASEAGVHDFLNEVDDDREIARRIRSAVRALGIARRARKPAPVVLVCNRCRKIRDDRDHWRELEDYLAERIGARVGPTICPDCYIKNFGPEFGSRGGAASIPETPMADLGSS